MGAARLVEFVPDPSWWQDNDGIARPLWDGEEQIVGGVVVAARLWAAARVSAWSWWALRPRGQPPQGAQTHDGISGGVFAEGSVAAFVAGNPRGAARVADHLAAFLEVVELDRVAADAMRERAWKPDAHVDADVESPLWSIVEEEPPVPPAAVEVFADVVPIRQHAPRSENPRRMK